MENEIIILKDDMDNEFRMQLIRRFEHEGATYVVLTEAHECDCGCEECGDECGGNVYVMKEDAADGEHCYSVVEEEKIDELVGIIREMLGFEDECGCDCGECSDECDCCH